MTSWNCSLCEQREPEKLYEDASHPKAAGSPHLGLFFGPGILSGAYYAGITLTRPENPDPKAIAKTEDCGA